MELHPNLKQEFPFLPNLLSHFSIKDRYNPSNYAFSSYHNNYHHLLHRHHHNPINGSTASFNPQNIGFGPLPTVETSSNLPLFGAYPTACNNALFHLSDVGYIPNTVHLNGFGGVVVETNQNRPRSLLNHELGFQQKIQDQNHLFSPFKINEVLGQLNNSKSPTDEIFCVSTTDEYDQFHNNNKKVVELANDDKKIRKKNKTIKGQWTVEEDRLLVKMVRKHGEKKWSHIAKALPGRIGKQCRERWHNHLRPDIRKDAWSEKEDRMLIEAHKEVGNKWSEIAKRLPGRTENTIKNHWNATKRKQLSKRKNNDSTSNTLLLHNYIKSLNIAPSPTNIMKEEEILSAEQLIGLHTQNMDCSEDLKALMCYDHDESNYTLGSSFFNDDINDEFPNLLHQQLPTVEETQHRDFDMSLDLDCLIKVVGDDEDMDLVEMVTRGSV